MTEENPFAAPESELSNESCEKDSREYLRRIARAHNIVSLAVFLEIVAILFAVAAPAHANLHPLSLGIAVFMVVNLIFILYGLFWLTAALDGPVLAIVWTLLSVIPPVGLLFLLINSHRAYRVLTKKGVKVGVFGTDVSSI